jgi:hypothetical protein
MQTTLPNVWCYGDTDHFDLASKECVAVSIRLKIPRRNLQHYVPDTKSVIAFIKAVLLLSIARFYLGFTAVLLPEFDACRPVIPQHQQDRLRLQCAR